MINIIIGETCSGKTTFLNDLRSKGFKTIVTTTTRPKRPGEIAGYDYFFTDEQEFNKLERKNEMIATFKADNGWMYGINVNHINTKKESFVILELQGCKELIDRYGRENVKVIKVCTSLIERLKRGYERDTDPKEFLRRILSDHRDFYDSSIIEQINIDYHFHSEIMSVDPFLEFCGYKQG